MNVGRGRAGIAELIDRLRSTDPLGARCLDAEYEQLHEALADVESEAEAQRRLDEFRRRVELLGGWNEPAPATVPGG